MGTTVHICLAGRLSLVAVCISFDLYAFLGGPGFDVTVLTATLGSSPAMTCMPSSVASNIRPISMAASRLRCCSSRGSVDVLAHLTICRLWRSELISQSP